MTADNSASIKRFGKIIIGIIFSIFFFAFILLSSINFQILNSGFLFYTFEKHDVYEKIPKILGPSLLNDPEIPRQERESYSQIIKNIPPQTIEKIVKDNLSSMLNFIHGKSQDIEISIPAKEMGLDGNDIYWSLKAANPEFKNQLKQVNGIGNVLLVIWGVILIILVSLFLLYRKLANLKPEAKRLFIINGSFLFIISAIFEILFFSISKGMPSSLEPSQAIIGILFSSLLPEIVLSWIITAIAVLSAGFIMKSRKVL